MDSSAELSSSPAANKWGALARRALQVGVGMCVLCLLSVCEELMQLRKRFVSDVIFNRRMLTCSRISTTPPLFAMACATGYQREGREEDGDGDGDGGLLWCYDCV